MQPLIYNPPTEPWLDVLHVDRDMMAINKPCGLLSNPGRQPEHQDSVLDRVRAEFPQAQIVNRLDLATSGIVIIALRKKAERQLKKAFQLRQVTKVYRAITQHRPSATEGQIDMPLICDWPNRPKQKVCHEHGKPALTRYRILAQTSLGFVWELYPVTGRSHQLRVHLAALGCPILGDEFYAPVSIQQASDRLMLHALRLEIAHPYSQQPMALYAPCENAELAMSLPG